MSITNPVDGLGVIELTATFARIQGMLLRFDQAAEAVHQLAEAARDTIDSAVGAGASLMDAEGTRQSAGTTDRVAAIADEAQYDLGEGPCLAAWATKTVVRIDDAAAENRWPLWCPVVLRLGVRSVLSAPMMYRGEAIGAMKVYSVEAGVFTVRDEQRLALLAGAAATLLGAAQSPDAPKQLTVALQGALADRRYVETATGILMERYGSDHDTARALLLSTSRTAHRPLTELAREVVSGSPDVAL